MHRFVNQVRFLVDTWPSWFVQTSPHRIGSHDSSPKPSTVGSLYMVFRNSVLLGQIANRMEIWRRLELPCRESLLTMRLLYSRLWNVRQTRTRKRGVQTYRTFVWGALTCSIWFVQRSPHRSICTALHRNHMHLLVPRVRCWLVLTCKNVAASKHTHRIASGHMNRFVKRARWPIVQVFVHTSRTHGDPVLRPKNCAISRPAT